MNFSERLDESIKLFEGETQKIVKVNELMRNIGNLLKVIDSEKKHLENTTQELYAAKSEISKSNTLLSNFTRNEEENRNKLIEDVRNYVQEGLNNIVKELSAPLYITKDELINSSRVLSDFTRNEEDNRKKLIEDIHNYVQEELGSTIKELSFPLYITKNELDNSAKQIVQFIEIYNKSREELLSSLESILIKYNSKYIEVYNNVTDTIFNRLSFSQNEIEAKIVNQFKEVYNRQDSMLSAVKSIKDDYGKIDSCVANVYNDIMKIKKDMSKQNIINMYFIILMISNIISWIILWYK